MILSVRQEMIVFAAALLCGQMIGVFFDFFRAIRKCRKESDALVHTEDIVFIVLAAFLLFKTIDITNNAAVRWYEFGAAAGGAMLYFSAESKFVMRFFCCCIRKAYTIISGIVTVLTKTVKLFCKPLCFAGHKIIIPIQHGYFYIYKKVKKFFTIKIKKIFKLQKT